MKFELTVKFESEPEEMLHIIEKFLEVVRS